MSSLCHLTYQEYLTPGVNRLRRVVCHTASTTQIFAGLIISKEITASFLKKEGLVQRKLHRIPNKYILPIHDQFTDDSGDGFIIYPLPYTDLFTYVKEVVVVVPETARKLFFQLVCAVKHCHDQRIILRDIKLGKIVFLDSQRTTVALADIDGCELGPEPGYKIADQKGSPAYIAPEILNHKPYDPYLADVWNLGVVLYVMLLGRYPFQDPKPSELYNLILTAEVKFPSHLLPLASNLLKCMLNRDTTQRATIHEVYMYEWFKDLRVELGDLSDAIPTRIPAQATSENSEQPGSLLNPEVLVVATDPTGQAFAGKDLIQQSDQQRFDRPHMFAPATTTPPSVTTITTSTLYNNNTNANNNLNNASPNNNTALITNSTNEVGASIVNSHASHITDSNNNNNNNQFSTSPNRSSSLAAVSHDALSNTTSRNSPLPFPPTIPISSSASSSAITAPATIFNNFTQRPSSSSPLRRSSSQTDESVSENKKRRFVEHYGSDQMVPMPFFTARR